MHREGINESVIRIAPVPAARQAVRTSRTHTLSNMHSHTLTHTLTGCLSSSCYVLGGPLDPEDIESTTVMPCLHVGDSLMLEAESK